MRRRRGFTILETVLTLGLFAILLLGLVFLFISFNSAYRFEQAQINTISAGTVMNKIEALVRPASSVVASHVISGTTYTTSAAVLVIEIPSVDSSGVTLANIHDYAVIYRTGTTVYSRVAPDATSARKGGVNTLSTSVSALSFTYDNADPALAHKVTADVTAEATYKGETVTAQLHEQISLRNVTP